jgi:hypothetical protein
MAPPPGGNGRTFVTCFPYMVLVFIAAVLQWAPGLGGQTRQLMGAAIVAAVVWFPND